MLDYQDSWVSREDPPPAIVEAGVGSVSVIMSMYEKIAHECVRKKDERGEQIMIQLDGRKRQRPLEDQEFIEIAKFLPQAIINLINSLNRGSKISVLEFHGENNNCRDAGAAAITKALLDLRQRNIAAVRAVFLWRNELGDEGAKSIAALVAGMALPGQERVWVAEVHLSHNNISSAGALAIFNSARTYPRAAFGGVVVQEHNCGVSQCCMNPVPTLHLHLVQTQDPEKVKNAAARNAGARRTGTNPTQTAPRRATQLAAQA
ncbi:hypothetical protein T484DRAFT_1894382, partial [Baffinella frigidus]